MRFIAIYLIAFILILLTFQNVKAEPASFDSSYDSSLLEYFGHDHSEAQIDISGYVIIDQITKPTKANIDPMISAQMRYMLGLMRSRSSQAAALYPKWSYTISEIKVIAAGSYLVKYDLKTKGVFPIGKRQYTFTLPINPKKIFTRSQGKCSDKVSAESNFWYHWEPSKPDCPLKENLDYFSYNSALRPLENTSESYPEYDKLADENKLIKMTVFFGFEKYGNQNWTPDGSEDWGIKAFNKHRIFLKSMGFSESVWNQQQIDVLYKSKDKFVPYISEFYLAGTISNIRIRLVLADTGTNHNSKAFHMIFKEALARESVVIYNGHSGIGHNLDLAAIEKMRGIKFAFNPKYQILFLGSCVPYSYYTEMFFNRKKTAGDPAGSLNLDILTYGKESIFGNTEDQALIKALTKYASSGEKQSYQYIIRSSPNYFFGVNGDEDNQKIKSGGL